MRNVHTVYYDLSAKDASAERAIDHAVKVLAAGGLVAFPTETVYGLAANGLDPKAVARIYEAKGRPSHNPVILHAADVEPARALSSAWTDQAERLAAHFWPGPLTLVLPRAHSIPDIVTAGGPTVAIRVPAHPVALALLRACGLPLAAPSANRSSRVSPTTAQHVLKSLQDRIEVILDGGPTPGGIESTVLSLAESPPRLLRPGPVSPSAIEEIIGAIRRDGSGAQTNILASPGMLSKHYSPRAVLEMSNEGDRRAAELMLLGYRVARIRLGEKEEMSDANVILPPSSSVWSNRLYAVLHSLDAMGVDRIVVDMVPDGEEWLAVKDRLTRASSKDT